MWDEIRRKHEEILLILAGTGGLDIDNCEEAVREYVRVNNLENQVLFTGAIQNIPEYLQALITMFFVAVSNKVSFPKTSSF